VTVLEKVEKMLYLQKQPKVFRSLWKWHKTSTINPDKIYKKTSANTLQFLIN